MTKQWGCGIDSGWIYGVMVMIDGMSSPAPMIICLFLAGMFLGCGIVSIRVFARAHHVGADVVFATGLLGFVAIVIFGVACGYAVVSQILRDCLN